MPIRLNIEAETVEEFDTLLARFIPDDYEPANDVASVAGEPAKPAAKRGGRKAKTEAAAPTQNPDGTPIPPVSEPVPQPTPGGTDAPPAESIPPNQAAQDPFAQPAAAASAEKASPTPSASSPETAAAQAAGDITVQNLKDAMADLLKAKSASFAMQTLEAASGCKSLTTGSPSVVEKAKDDPTLMKTVYDALVAAKA